MTNFIDFFQDKIQGRIDCFDRIVFKGYLPIGYPGAMVALLNRNDCLIKDAGKFVAKHTEIIVQHAKDFAEKHGRPYAEIKYGQRKEDHARTIAEKDGITEGSAADGHFRANFSSWRL